MGFAMSAWLYLRINWKDGAMGPHIANMLEAIDRFGTLTVAAPAVDLSYRQLWRMVQKLNAMFDRPLIKIRRSGRTSGAVLTPLGKETLACFREIQRVANKTLAQHFRRFEQRVGDDSNAPPPIPRFARIIDPSTIRSVKRRAAGRKITASTKKPRLRHPR
jgi:molybdate transport system regulatory protein